MPMPTSRRVAVSRRQFLAGVALTPAVIAGACGSSDTAGGADGDGADAPTTTMFDVPADELVDMTGSDTVTVTVTDNLFEPRYITVTAGTTVVWRNDGRVNHNVIPANEGDFEGIDHDEFVPGSSHIVVFDDVGDVGYFCSIHGTMRNGQNGVVRVVAAN